MTSSSSIIDHGQSSSRMTTEHFICHNAISPSTMLVVCVKTRSSATAERPYDALFHELWELQMFQTAKVTFKVIGNWAI